MSKTLLCHGVRSICHKLQLLAICCSTAFALPAYASQLSLLSDAELLVFQRDLARNYLADKQLDDNVADYYLQRTADRLQVPLRMHVLISSEKQVNAVAAWGQLVIINAGLFDLTRNESELIGVLAHETAHISQNHFTRLPEQLKQTTALTALAIITSIAARNSKVGNALAATAQGSLQLATIDQIKAYEREADIFALDIIQRAGLDESGLATMLGLLKGGIGVPEYLRTHPISQERISSIEARIRQSSSRAKPASKDDDLDFRLIQARVRFLTGIRQRAQDQKAQSQTVRDYLAVSFGQGSDAQAAAERLEHAHKDNWIIVCALADHYSRAGKPANAAKLLATAQASDRSNPVLAAVRLNILAALKDRSAGSLLLGKLQPAVSGHPAVADAESQFWLANDDQFQYRIALARKYYATGQLKLANRQLAHARNIAEQFDREKDDPKLVQLEKNIETLEKKVERAIVR